MNLLKQLCIFLATKTSVTNLTSTRIYQTHLPQDYDWSGPAISMQKISEVHHHNLVTSSGVASARVQIDCWGLDEDSVNTLAEQVRLILQSYSGSINDATVLGISLAQQLWAPESPDEGSAIWKHRVISDYIITYRNATAPA